MTRILTSSLIALAITMSATIAPAVTHTWNGSTASMALNTNWLGNVTPTSGDPSLTLNLRARWPQSQR